MIKTKDGYAKVIGVTYKGSPNHLLQSDGGAWAVHTARNNEANKIVRTDTSGYLNVGWINTLSGNMNTTTIDRVYCSNDSFVRYKTPANFFSTLANSGDDISITVASQNRVLTVAYAKVAGELRSKGTKAPQTERTQELGDVYSYHLNASVSGGPTTYAAVIGFGKGTAGTVEIAGEWTSGRGVWVRALRDTTDDWYKWDKVLTQATYTSITDSRYYTKTQSDERFVNVTGDDMTGNLKFTNVTGLIQTSNTTSNYTTLLKWYNGDKASASGTYDAQIGRHNTGHDGKGAITILPYPTTTSPWDGSVGLYVGKNMLKLDGKVVLHSGNYTSYFGYIGKTKVQASSADQALTGISSINGRLSIAAESDQTRLGFGAVHNVVFGEPGYAHRIYYFRPSYGSQGTTNTTIIIQNASAASSPTWTTTHSFDYNGTAIHVGHTTAAGFKKKDSSDSYVLLGGGGHKKLSDIQAEYDGRYVNITGDTMSGELSNTSANAFRLKGSSYGVFFRNDNSHFYILLTNSGNPTGSYNSLRPFYINLSSGRVTIGNGLSVSGTIVGNNTISGTQLISTIAQGTAPLKVSSDTMVSKLHADLLDGYHASTLFSLLANDKNQLSITIGGTNKKLTVAYASQAGYLQSHDTRSVKNTPAQFSSGARFEFKSNSTDGLSDGGSYHGILHFKPSGGTTDFSGGQTHQLGFTDGGNLWMRTSTNSSTWGVWKLILNQGTADGRYVNVPGDTMTGKLSISINSSSSQSLSLTNTTDGWTYMTMGNGTSGAKAAHIAWKTTADGAIPANAYHIRPGCSVSIAAFTSGAIYLASRLIIDSTGRCYPINSNARRTGMYGTYDSYRIGHIWSMGTGYMIPDNGANFGNLYGLAYKHTNNSTGGTMAGGHQAVWCENGTPKAALGANGVWAAGGFYKAGSNATHLLRGDGGQAAFNWDGQTGQPTWLWGGNSQHSYYVYNPSNFRVAYASDSDKLDGYHSTAFLRYEGWWTSGDGHNVNNATGMIFSYTSHGAPAHWGTTATFEYSRGSGYNLQLHGTGDNRLYFRNKSSDYGQKGWLRVVTSEDSLKNPYSLTLQTNGSTQTTYNGSSAKTFNVTVQNAGSGLLHNALTLTVANTTSNSGWSMINSSYNGFILKSIRTQGSAPNWIEGNYASGICFGGADTKGVISTAYGSPAIRFAGGNGSRPVWWIRIMGTNGATYNLANMWTGTGYWANIAVSTTSSTGTSPTFSTCYTSNWFRSNGSTGWLNATHGGGWYMSDTTYIRAHGNKRVYTANADQYAFYTAGGMTAIKGFWHPSVNSNSYVLLAGGSYKQWSESSSNSTIVARSGSGNIYATYFNSNISNQDTMAVSSIYCSNDNFIRKMSLTAFKKQFAVLVPGQIISLYTSSTVSAMFTSYTSGSRGKTNARYTVDGATYEVDLSKFILLTFTEQTAIGIQRMYGNYTGAGTEGSNSHVISSYEMPAHRHFLGVRVAKWGDNGNYRNFPDFNGTQNVDGDYDNDPARFMTRYAGAGISDNVYSWNVSTLGKTRQNNSAMDVRQRTYYAITMVYKP